MDKKIVWGVVILFLILVFYGNFGFLPEKTSKMVYDVLLIVGNNASFSSQGNKLFFEIPAGKVLQGSISVQNKEKYEREMEISVSGELKDLRLVEVIEPRFKLNSEEIREVGIKIIAPLKKGRYAGKILVEGRGV